MKKILIILFACFLLTGCGESAVSQEEYDKVVAERDDYKSKYEFYSHLCAEMQAEATLKELAEKTETAKTAEIAEKGGTVENNTVLYEDSNIKIYFSEITDRGVVFLVENMTDLNLTIQADTVSVNGFSTNDIIMSDDVAPQSKGKVVAKCDDFSADTAVETIGGQLSVIDFSQTWEPYHYDVKFVNVPIE